MRFYFMLNVDKKSRGKWKDLELPFPADETTGKDLSGLSQLPSHLQGIIYRPDKR